MSDEIFSPQGLIEAINLLGTQIKVYRHESIKAGNDKNLVSFDIIAATQQLEELEARLKTAPRATITLAAMPSEGMKRDISTWMRQNIEPSLLMEFSYNSALLGGMVIRIGSHIYDWSFRRQILVSAGEFTKVLRRV